MKLAIKDNRIIAKVTDRYIPPVDTIVIDVDDSFDFNNASKYSYVNELLTRIVPNYVTMRQARLALHAAGLLSSVNTLIEAIQNPVLKEQAKIEWEYAVIVMRSSTIVSMLASSLNLTQTQLDNLFITADSIPD